MFSELVSKVGTVLDTALGLRLQSEQLGYVHMLLRAALMYVLLIWIIRSAKKRFLGQPTAFDVILVIVLGSIAARALTGGAPFFPCVLAMFVLIAMHWVFSYTAERYPAFGGIIKGHPTLLVRSGSIDRQALRDAHMSRADLNEELRQKGIGDISVVSEARLERSGHLSVLKHKDQGP